MSFPPEFPEYFPIDLPKKYGEQRQTRTVELRGNMNAFACAVCVLALSWTLPRTFINPILVTTLTVISLIILYCAIMYGLRAYHGYLSDYNSRAKFVFANDTSRTVQGADAKFASLADLANIGMIDNPNERILGALDGEPIFAPPSTTFVKYVGMSGSYKTSTYVFNNILHILNTQGRLSFDDEHEAVEIEEREFDSPNIESDDFDEFLLDGEVM